MYLSAYQNVHDAMPSNSDMASAPSTSFYTSTQKPTAKRQKLKIKIK